MDKLISCEFNIDTACVELRFMDGSRISIDCTAVEDKVAHTIRQRSELGDYYFPDLALDDGADCEIGAYGRMRERFLEEHHPGTYTGLLLTGKLWKHLADIDAACHERMDFLILAMAKQEGGN